MLVPNSTPGRALYSEKKKLYLNTTPLNRQSVDILFGMVAVLSKNLIYLIKLVFENKNNSTFEILGNFVRNTTYYIISYVKIS